MNFTCIVLPGFIQRFMKITYCSCCFTGLLYNAQNYPAALPPFSIFPVASMGDLPNNNLSKSPVYINPRQHAFQMQIPAPAEDTAITYTYKQTGELKILADVYPAAGEMRPVVVWIHGGALIMGNRKGVPDWLLETCREK